MAVSLNSYLTQLSAQYYLKANSNEADKIQKSLNLLKSWIKVYFGDKLNRVFEFGSWDRDTILPRRYDEHSDIDIMVVFNHSEYERTPETYRAWLENFAKDYYSRSSIYRSAPTITIELNHIKYDLVPAKEEEGFFGQKYLYIPDSSNGWQDTDPYSIRTALTAANTSYNYVVRPIIRIFKAWNSYNNYPFDSYELELKITGMNFSNDNIQSGFFYAVGQLDTYSNSTNRNTKVQSLKYNIDKAKDSLDKNDVYGAIHWLHKVLPY